MNSTSAEAPFKLRSLGNAGAPTEMASDLRSLLNLPEPAQHHFWEALGPSLPEPIPASVESRLTQFCERFGAPESVLARAVKASRHLCRGAAMYALEKSAFTSDIFTLLGEADGAAVSSILMVGFDAAVSLLRGEMRNKTISELRDRASSVDYQVSKITASRHAEALDIRVLSITFHKASGESVHIVLSPDQVAELSRACALASR
ncbi:MAG: hypothetical protein IPK82_12395 [Polyangiaceae bacterium]|nr:hypothetical protein [Polyangiaceae bacterium]